MSSSRICPRVVTSWARSSFGPCCSPTRVIAWDIGGVDGWRSFTQLFLPDSEYFSAEYEAQLIEFVSGTDALITDTTYTDAEYAARVGWGHSCVSRVADLAHRASVETLYLFHHDPDQNDDAIDAKLETVAGLLADWGSSVRCVAPREGDRIRI